MLRGPIADGTVSQQLGTECTDNTRTGSAPIWWAIVDSRPNPSCPLHCALVGFCQAFHIACDHDSSMVRDQRCECHSPRWRPFVLARDLIHPGCNSSDAAAIPDSYPSALGDRASP